MGNDLKNQILVHNGIITEEAAVMQRKPSVLTCPRCSLVNALDNKYCSKCSYPLVPSAFDEIKEAENAKVEAMAEKYKQEIEAVRDEMRDEMKKQITQLMTILKPEIVKEGLS